jgi:hypothetical protein
MLLTGSGDELCGLLSALFHAEAYHPPHCWPFCLSSLCLLKVCMEISSLPLLWCAQSTLPPLLHVPFQFLVYYSVLFCFVLWGRGQSVQGAMLFYPRGSCGNTTCLLFGHLLVCISQAGLEPASGGAGAFLVSQCNVAWRSFVWDGVQGVGLLILLGVFFLPSVAPASQQNF